MNAKDIERYLTLVGWELKDVGVQEPIQLLMIGGSYMLTQIKSRAALFASWFWYNEDRSKIKERGCSVKRDQLQTIRITFQQICAGERDWTALGNFMNYWYSYAKDRREELVADPILPYDEHSLYQHRWAVFCAAAAEWFCKTYHVPCPEWVYEPRYVLLEPWFFDLREPAKSWLLQTTPEEFQRRNVFCGDDCFANKWEWAEQYRQHRQRISL